MAGDNNEMWVNFPKFSLYRNNSFYIFVLDIKEKGLSKLLYYDESQVINNHVYFWSKDGKEFNQLQFGGLYFILAEDKKPAIEYFCFLEDKQEYTLKITANYAYIMEGWIISNGREENVLPLVTFDRASNTELIKLSKIFYPPKLIFFSSKK